MSMSKLKKFAQGLRPGQSALTMSVENYGHTRTDAAVVARVANQINEFLRDEGLVANPSVLSLENYGDNAVIAQSADIEVVGANKFLTLAESVAAEGTPRWAVESLAEEFASIVDAKTMQHAIHFGRDRDTQNLVPLNHITGDMAYGMIQNDSVTALEAFGVSMDTVQTDARLNMQVAALRTYQSIADRLLPRIVQEQNTITIKVPMPEVYDLAASRDPKAAVRNYGSHKQPVISLYTNPGIVSTEPKIIVPLMANDDSAQPKLLADGVLRTGGAMNLFDLAAKNEIGYNAVDYTDLVSEGAYVTKIHVKATKPGSPAVSETFVFDVDFLASARYTMTANNQDSGDRTANVRSVGILTKDSETAAESASAIFAGMDSAKVQLDLRLSTTLNLKNANIEGSGTANKLAVPVSTAAIDSDDQTLIGSLVFEIIGFEIKAWYSEENLRKTTTALRTGGRLQQFEIPVGRSALVDFSLGQDTPDDVLELVNMANSIGNSIRALSIIESKLASVKRQVDFETANPQLSYLTQVANEYAAGSKSLPQVVVDEIDFDEAGNSLAVLRESERMTEVHARLRARLLAIIGALLQKSLYHRNLADGEKPVFKVVTSTYLATVLFGITDYHNVFNDYATEPGKKAPKSDFSMYLPDGTRLDVIKTEFKDYADRILMIPVRDNAPTDVTSFGAVHDRGTFTAQFTPQTNGAVNRRIVTNSREIVFTTNPMGAVLTVKNLAKHIKQFLPIGNLT